MLEKGVDQKDICKSCRERWVRTFLNAAGDKVETEEGCDKGYYYKKGEITIKCDGFEKETRQHVLQGR